MRIFYSFIIIVGSTILWLLPVTEAIYSFKTDAETDSFTVTTGDGVTTSTVQLSTELYDDDTSTIDIISGSIYDAPYLSSYNGTSRALVVAGLSANITRVVDVTYDVDAIEPSGGISNLLDNIPWIWTIIWVAFPVAGLVAIWTGRA